LVALHYDQIGIQVYRDNQKSLSEIKAFGGNAIDETRCQL